MYSENIKENRFNDRISQFKERNHDRNPPKHDSFISHIEYKLVRFSYNHLQY